MSAASKVIHTWAVRVHGRVQGIGFRDACVRQARSLGLTGWVRNRSDGSVEAVLQGWDEPLAQMREWLGGGMPTATVDRLDVDPLTPPVAHYDQFERRRTPLD